MDSAVLNKSPSAEEGGAFRFGRYELVGHGKETNEECATYFTTKVCLHTELHKGTHFEKGGLVDHTGQAYIKKVFRSCDKPSCPKCFKYGWASREAHRIEHRLKEASKTLGKGNKKSSLVEHVIVSFPESMWGLPVPILRKKAVEGLMARGVFGGVMIFHAARYGRGKHWHLGIHFHVLGFIRGGYGCRGCKKWCPSHPECNGFENRTIRMNKTDGLIAKIAEDMMGETKKRRTVGGTAWYLLHHACIVHGAKRPHVCTWFGSCSYRRLKVIPMIKIHAKCPCCGNELVSGWYNGSKGMGLKSFFAPLIEDGVEVCGLKEETRYYGSGSYED